MNRIGFVALAACLSVGPMLTSVNAAPRKEIRVGMISTFTTAAGAGGEALRSGIDLALEKLGGKLGGIPVKMTYEDDQFDPSVARQKVQKLIQDDNVDFILGFNYSNVLLGSLKAATDAKTFVLSAAGPRQVAGELCSPWYFNLRDQNDQAPQGLGKVLSERGVKSLYLVAANYAAGKDMVQGIKSSYTGKIVGEDMTKWPTQLDFSAEIAKIRSANPEGVFLFLPIQHASQFLSQFAQAGLKGVIPIYSVYTFDGITLPIVGTNALGSLMVQHWSPDLKFDGNAKFVEAFRAKHKADPSIYAAAGYDMVMLLDSAVSALGGDLDDKEKTRQALRAAEFESTRGKLQFGNNQFLIQDYYLLEVAENANREVSTKTLATVIKSSQDQYAAKCSMK